MQTLGNDFLVLNGTKTSLNLDAAWIKKWADRKTGVGFDQCLVILRSQKPKVDFDYQIYNADGTEVGQCGNGARCIAKYIEFYGLSSKKQMRIATKTTELVLSIKHDQVCVEFMSPKFDPESVPMNFLRQQSSYSMQGPGLPSLSFHALNVGNPHIGFRVPSVQAINVAEMGRVFSEHPCFPEQTNVEFFEILNRQQIKLRVYERGCGETLACGSGAAAASVMGRLYHHMKSHIEVFLPGGSLQVIYEKPGDTVKLIGGAEFVYEGELFECS